ncbi:MAG: hypothetical protein M0R06_02550 [Sphaerochaeta sp.]|jgi:hypothetical protein|nr:hypothetical protein [Sphaerochaeta sp.]
MNLADIKIVDLKTSVVDEKLSKPKDGNYEFKSKKYIDYKGRSGRPDYWFTWIRHEPSNNFREEREARYNSYTYVVQGVDPYWPEPLVPDAEGHYVYGDVVLMKRPLLTELDARIKNAELSRGMAKAKVNAFNNALIGENAELSDKMIKSILGM